jgi:hypothetical protein
VGTPHKQADTDFAAEVSRLIFENKLSALSELWKKLDAHAQAEIIAYIGIYIGRNSEQAIAAERRRRGTLIKRALSNQIEVLRKAYEKRAAFEEIRDPHLGSVVSFGDPFWPQGHGPLSTILSTEIIRLNKLLGQTKDVFNAKRFGISDKHYWLIYAQEFFRVWTLRHLGNVLELTPTHLADLIDAASRAVGQERTDTPEPENIRKALVNFRKNPRNKVFCELIEREYRTGPLY